MRVLKKSFILIIVFLLSVSPIVAYASSSEVNRLKKEHQEAQNEVNDINRQKKEAEDQAKALTDTANQLSDKITKLNTEISGVTEEMNETENSISQTQSSLDELLSNLKEVQGKLDLQDISMRKRIQFMYENKSNNTIVNLIESGSLSDMMQRLEYMAAITSYDKEAIENYKSTRTVLKETQAMVEQKYQELSAYQNKLEGEKNELDTLVSQNAGILSATKTELANTNAAIAELETRLEEAKKKEAELSEKYMDAQNALAQSMAGYSEYTGGSYEGYSTEEMLLLAALVQAEADNQGEDGRAAVASVVMNRVFSSQFPNSIAGVIYSNGQFAPVTSGRVGLILAQGPNANCQRAAVNALNGARRTNALFFCTYSYAQMRHNQQVEAGQSGMLDRTYGEVIGAHYFYNY